jgi:hypothetical protein
MKKKITKAKLLKQKKSEVSRKDKEWSAAIRLKFNNKCAFCGSDKNFNAAHIIPREIEEFRWDLDNGLGLCATHHRWHPKLEEDGGYFSAHFNPFYMLLWFSNTHIEQFTKLVYKWEDYLIKKQEEKKNGMQKL